MSKRAKTALRMAALVALIGVLYVAGTHPSIRPYFSIEYLRAVTGESGVVGMAAFVALYTGGYLLQIPGLPFVLVALLAWGPWLGSLVAFLGSIAATTASFWTFRSVGGSPLDGIEHDWARKALDHIDDHPIRTVALLRAVFYVNPVINLPLVLSGVRFRDYLIGSILGFGVPLTTIALLMDLLLNWFGIT